MNQDYFNTGLVPPLVLQVLDHDQVFKDDLLGHCVIQLRDITAEMPEKPTWHPIKRLGSGEVAGRVLVSLQIVPLEKLSDKIPPNLKINRLPIGKLHGRVPTPLEVGMRRCTVEFFLLGCRRLQPKGHIKPRSPFVTCKLNGDTVRGLIQTAPQSNPTPVGPNYLETLRLNCWLPDRPTFSPSITISVFDRQFGVLNPLLGTACIQLQKYLPWIPKNRQRIKARYALSGVDATAADQQDAEPEPEPDIDDDAVASLQSDGWETTGLLSDESAQQADVETPRPPSRGQDGEVDLEKPWIMGRLINGKVLDKELEEELENRTHDGATRHPFDEWNLLRKLQTDDSGAIATNIQAGNTYGCVKGLVRIVDHDETDNSKEVPFPLDLRRLQHPEQVVVRVYCTQGYKLAAMDPGNSSDPYVVAALGRERQGDSSEHIRTTTDPYFGRCFEFFSTMPGPANLTLTVKDYDIVGRDEEIGRTVIDLEDRWFSQQWKSLAAEKAPLERRTLRRPGSETFRGTLECWVDIMTKEKARNTPVVDIAMPPPGMFEMRLVVWRARKIPALDVLTNMNDMFINAELTTVGIQNGKPDRTMRETDVHWRAKGNKGSFNWRMKFDVELPMSGKSPNKLTLKCLDKDPMTFSEDMIGYADIDVGKKLFEPALRKWRKYRALYLFLSRLARQLLSWTFASKPFRSWLPVIICGDMRICARTHVFFCRAPRDRAG